jgi:hypothetical protein
MPACAPNGRNICRAIFRSICDQPAPSFRGREPSERSPESINRSAMLLRWTRDHLTGWDYGFRARRQVGRPTCRAPE